MKSLNKALMTLVLAMMLPLGGIAQAPAAEVIHAYSTDITLNDDGSVRVLETIEVRAEGIDIRRGIYRDIPTVLVNDDGSRLYSDLTIHSVERDGEQEPWHSEGIENGLRLYIGDADILLETPADYTYTIDYSMTRMARRFADRDELYFNAIGPYWDFPIDSAVARVTLPTGAVITDLQGYTGGHGSKEQAVTISKPSDNQAIFRATRALEAYEGMTVSASFAKGVLAAPSPTDSAFAFLSDRRAELVPAIAALVVLIYNLWAWLTVGRDPPKGTIIPQFYPPKDLSPARAHYVHRMGWQRNGWLAFTAGLIDLAVKGLLVLGKDDKKNTIAATEAAVPADLPQEEAELRAYFTHRGTVRVDKNTGPALAKQLEEFKKRAKGQGDNPWFRLNVLHIVLSVVLSAIMLGWMLWAGVIDPVFVFIAIFATAFLSIFATALGGVFNGSWVTRAFLFLWFGFFVFNAGGALLGFITDIASGITIGMPVLALATIVLVNAVFGALMRAPTVEGRRVMDDIDGFRMYLETAEKERLNFSAEPQMTVSRFETILPYAVALGVEKPWTERFENDLARNAIQDVDGTGYHPHWHSGSDFRAGSMGRDVAAFATGMSAAMIAAQPSSSSSSGGGGGGSSGGGGGGGGGGGW
ncbi:MAG: DUF2207 domain-containing protein [Alphaproteobacteria bacterium]|nr:DUF2207 domain-containing protein [Alphaproteobacteria bacterium]